jgi:hypothetical protein
MALLPIDLQTVFSQATQVGKEQAVQKDAPPLAQSLQGAQLAQQAEIRDTSVNQTPDQQDEAVEKVKDRARRGAERRKRQQKGAQPPAAHPAAAADVVRDPALGRNVDITG